MLPTSSFSSSTSSPIYLVLIYSTISTYQLELYNSSILQPIPRHLISADMSSIGNVLNKATGKTIPVYLNTSGQGFIRPTGAISQSAKNLALAKVKAAFEDGKLFTDASMKTIERLDIRYVAAKCFLSRRLAVLSSCYS